VVWQSVLSQTAHVCANLLCNRLNLWLFSKGLEQRNTFESRNGWSKMKGISITRLHLLDAIQSSYLMRYKAPTWCDTKHLLDAIQSSYLMRYKDNFIWLCLIPCWWFNRLLGARARCWSATFKPVYISPTLKKCDLLTAANVKSLSANVWMCLFQVVLNISSNKRMSRGSLS